MRKFIWHAQDKGEIEKRERDNCLKSSSRIDLDYIESWLHKSYQVSTSWLKPGFNNYLGRYIYRPWYIYCSKKIFVGYQGHSTLNDEVMNIRLLFVFKFVEANTFHK